MMNSQMTSKTANASRVKLIPREGAASRFMASEEQRAVPSTSHTTASAIDADKASDEKVKVK